MPRLDDLVRVTLEVMIEMENTVLVQRAASFLSSATPTCRVASCQPPTLTLVLRLYALALIGGCTSNYLMLRQ